MTDYIVVNYMDTDWTPNAGTYIIPVSAIENLKSVDGVNAFKSIDGKMINEKDTSDEETNTILKIDQLLRHYDDEFLEGTHPDELAESSERGILEQYKVNKDTRLYGINIVGMVSTGFLF